MSAFTVDGDLVHYEKLGRDRPVILLHGWIGSWRYWIPTMQQLQAKFSVYALDFFGFGDSSKNSQKYTLDKQVELLAAFVRELGIQKAAFVAHGLGALILAEYARRYSAVVHRALFVSAPLFDTNDLADRNPPGERRPLAPPPLNIPPKPAPPSTSAPTIATRPSTPLTPAHSAPTIVSGGTIDRATLARTAADLKLDFSVPGVPSPIAGSPATTTTPPAPPPPPLPALGNANQNPLSERLNSDLESLLAKCFRRSEPAFEKLKLDIAKTDAAALRLSVMNFDSLEMLDKLHLIEAPLVFVHGSEDSITDNPNENVWNYLARTKTDEQLLALPMQGVRHFPMLENDRFSQLVTDFLEKADISTIEVQERWRRRSR
ncbi:MAG: alpha/beta hydrolase [Chloroflexi bacterium]|nr:alpha/beta hydrolase [Chloroflexota bacterium]